jgi:hypothetical protein
VAAALLVAAVVCIVMVMRARRRNSRDAAAALPGPAGWQQVAQDSTAGAAGIATAKPPPPPHGYRYAGDGLASSSKPRQATAPSAADMPGMPGGAGALPRPPVLQPAVVLGVPGGPAAQGYPAPAVPTVARLPHEAMAPPAGSSSGGVSRI